MKPSHVNCNTSGCMVGAKIIKINQREERGGGDIMAWNAVRGPDVHDRKVGGEWARAYKTPISKLNWREQEGAYEKR